MTSSWDKHANTKMFIRFNCTNLTVDDVDWENASDPDPLCNCMGFAVGSDKWWEPPVYNDGVLANPTDYWPLEVDKDKPRDISVWSYVEAAKEVGFRKCRSAKWENGYDKITLMYDSRGNDEFRHAVLHISEGVWKSKIGWYSDIEHPPDALDGSYGDKQIHMRRAKIVVRETG